MSRGLDWFTAHPPNPSMYCSGGAGLVAASNHAHAEKIVRDAGLDLYPYNWVHGQDWKKAPRFRYLCETNEPAGIVEYEGVSE